MEPLVDTTTEQETTEETLVESTETEQEIPNSADVAVQDPEAEPNIGQAVQEVVDERRKEFETVAKDICNLWTMEANIAIAGHKIDDLVQKLTVALYTKD